MSGLHPANVLQTTDVIYAAEAGLLIGGTLGVVVGVLVAMYYPIGEGTLQGGMVAVIGGLGGYSAPGRQHDWHCRPQSPAQTF